MRSLRPRLEAVRPPVNGHGAEKPRIVRDSEELLSRFDALDANIDSWVGQMETASKQVKEFQVGNLSAEIDARMVENHVVFRRRRSLSSERSGSGMQFFLSSDYRRTFYSEAALCMFLMIVYTTSLL